MSAAVALAPGDLWAAWSWEPVVVVMLVLSASLYARGIARMWAASKIGAGVREWEAAAFGVGWLTFIVALISPLHALGGVLFSAHMTQHELLISIGAPLIVLGRPLIPFLWALPPAWRQSLGNLSHRGEISGSWRVLTVPSVAFSLHAIALWVWHLPGPYQATLRSELVHSLQHASFIFTALLFWWTILSARGGEIGRGRAVFYLFATGLQSGSMGSLLKFATSIWYPDYAAKT
jgi:putative membrane protein